MHRFAVKCLCLFLFLCVYPSVCRADSEAVEYLIELGESELKNGDIGEAETHFQKALMVSPYNARAKEYLQQIAQKQPPVPQPGPGQDKILYSAAPLITAKSAEPTPIASVCPVEEEITSTCTIPAREQSPKMTEAVGKALDSFEAAEETTSMSGVLPAQTVEDLNGTTESRSVYATVVPETVPAEKSAPATEPIVQLDEPRRISQARGIEEAVFENKNSAMSENIPWAPAMDTGEPQGNQEEFAEENEALREYQPLKVKGQIQAGIGVDSNQLYWNRSFPLMQQIAGNKPWQYLWGPRRYNSYDTGIYSRYSLTLDDQQPDSPFSIHVNIVIDPYSFVGVRQIEGLRSLSKGADGTFTVHDPAADRVDVTLKYFPGGNTTLDEVYRSASGNIVNVPPIKVKHFTDTSLTWAPGADETWGANDPHNGLYQLARTELEYKYRIIRELFFDYKDQSASLRVFPFAYEDQAYISDDPLKLSGNKIYWEENPWLDYFEPSVAFDRPGSPIKKATWVRKYSFISKDMDLRNLTLLRGFKLQSRAEGLESEYTAAAPLNFWQDYGNVNTLDQAVRLKYGQDEYLGLIITSKSGFYKQKMEGKNMVAGIDGAAYIGDTLKASFEIAGSYTSFDHALDVRETYKGVSIFAGLDWEKVRFYTAYLDNEFYPGLTSYRYTRDDTYYGKYVVFDKLSGEELAFMKGNSIERGRVVKGISYKQDFLDKKLAFDIDVRNAFNDSGENKETVARWDTTVTPNKKLTLKSLVWYEFLPKTVQGQDPLITADRSYALTDFFALVNEPLENASITAGKDPSIGWFGFGGKYDLLRDLSLEGIYQYTNDPRDYPRTLLTSTFYTDVTDNGRLYDKVVPFLYDQDLFGLPPYGYYSIIKGKVLLTVGKAALTLRYTKNQNKYDVGVDDNVNHIGFNLKYKLRKDLEWLYDYTYTKFVDLYEQAVNHQYLYSGHHNFFTGLRYLLDSTQSIDFLYGQVYGYTDGSSLWALGPADTIHLFRLIYKAKF